MNVEIKNINKCPQKNKQQYKPHDLCERVYCVYTHIHLSIFIFTGILLRLIIPLKLTKEIGYIIQCQFTEKKSWIKQESVKFCYVLYTEHLKPHPQYTHIYIHIQDAHVHTGTCKCLHNVHTQIHIVTHT